MLSNPYHVKQSLNVGPNVYTIPLIPDLWYKISPSPQAAKVFALIAKIPGASLELVSYTKQGQTEQQGPLDPEIILPVKNPLAVDAWGIVGTVPAGAADSGETIQVTEYAGGLFDRGPADQGFGGVPDPEIDSNGAYGTAGGEYLVYSNVTPGAPSGQGLAQFRWSATPQGPVSA
jgi:hypothetical protein